ncbi:hypothetical protein [Flammeovirga kamogawensis]|uniref:Uncharacterized protein n=1 Tax=Flammeovirga kamogawensis TaxID=373891 RepID=A0ABX8GTJ4_9BACT|nr:hypothetical protein [Flammeovirga kamogawensis]MBB6462524.1 ABC-type transport system involved in multi-copper enzyme maturation permease subunit [Flammeovirga kamogawensis]QWG06739.1 hypothetical protein KM029_15725 [Flammeovirga kamogawensis]TRX68562.1 hypothetical protein EO216_10720 [Flammeovirga kamogawensis]
MSTDYTYQSYTEDKQPKWNWKYELLKFLGKCILFFVLITFPFILLIRTSIFLYHSYNVPTWLGLIGGMSVVSICLFLYLFVGYSFFIKSEKYKFSHIRVMGIASFVVVIAYVVFAVFSFSGKNAQTNKVKSEYADLHPYLKISVRTLLFFDKNVLITSLSRVPEDYNRMGLQTKKRSLHYIQNTGYTHAMDLRTKGRPFWMIWIAQIYFNILGFNVVRHTGTADHLHISISTYERQGSW